MQNALPQVVPTDILITNPIEFLPSKGARSP